jgi:hypothetical protein
MLYRLFTTALLLACVHAFPNYAGSCKSPSPLVGSSHLKSGTAGALSAAGLQLKINGSVVSPGTAFTFAKGKNLVISLSSTNGKPFRGFLMRIGKGTTDTTGFLKVGSDSSVQVASQCTSSKIGGISQKSASSKTQAKGVLRVNSVISGLKLEVTVVVQNGDSGSTWYKSDYTLNAK